MDTKFKRMHFRTVITIIIGVVLLLAAFSIGEFVGFHKASFAYQNGNNFYRTFGPMSNHGLPLFPDAHGVVGKVVNVTLPTITVEDRDNTEKVVTINDQTIIRYLRQTLPAQDITVGSYVVVIGQPNDQSQITAVLIRVIPPPSV